MNENLEWIYLKSAKILRIAYDGQNMYVEFIKKQDIPKYKHHVYKYNDVPIEIYNSILNKDCISKSKNMPSYGATLYQLVEKNNQYDYIIMEYNSF